MSARSGGRASACDRTVTLGRPFGLMRRPVRADLPDCRPRRPPDTSPQVEAVLGCRMASVSVRYIVDDVDAAIAFYCGHLGFEEVMHPAPAFAMLARGDL